MLKSFTLSIFTILLLTLSVNARGYLTGETDGAYVQTMERTGSSFNDRMDRKKEVFYAKVKIRESGSYYVIAGFFKGSCWHRGFTGMEYFKYKRITGDIGDTFNVYIEDIPAPPLNSNATIGIFKSLNDICFKK